jgi:hypothetical protein
MVSMFKWGSLIVAPSMKTTYVHRSLVAAVGGTFLRGVLDKVGVEPQVQRIGAYKSAGELMVHRLLMVLPLTTLHPVVQHYT